MARSVEEIAAFYKKINEGWSPDGVVADVFFLIEQINRLRRHQEEQEIALREAKHKIRSLAIENVRLLNGRAKNSMRQYPNEEEDDEKT